MEGNFGLRAEISVREHHRQSRMSALESQARSIWASWGSRAAAWRSEPLLAFQTRQGGYEAALMAAFLLPTLRAVSRLLFFQPLGKQLLRQRLKVLDSHKRTELINKWNESCWKSFFYVSIVALTIAAAWHEKFVYDTRYFWIGCNRFPPCNYDIPFLMRLMYSLQLGFYVQAIPYLIFWEVRRKDFWENFAHHIATIGLITYSYHVNFMKIGTMVFLCHDINDVFMEVAKLCKYAERGNLANCMFALFMVSWFASRMFYFPLWVIRSAWSEPLTIVANVYNLSPHPHHEIFLSLLLFLFGLHCYWSYLILRIAVRQLQTGQAEDIREKDE